MEILLCYCCLEDFKLILYICFLYIVGTTKIKNLEQNVGSLKVKLTKDDIKEISDAVPISEVAGTRNTDNFQEISWKFANTPPKDSK